MNDPMPTLAARKQRVRQDIVRAMQRCRRLYNVSVAVVLITVALGPIGMLAQRITGIYVTWPWYVYWVVLVAVVFIWMARLHWIRKLDHHHNEHAELDAEEASTQGPDHGE